MIDRKDFAVTCARNLQKTLSQAHPESEKDIAIALTMMAEITLATLHAMIGDEHIGGLMDEMRGHIMEKRTDMEIQIVKMRVKDSETPTAH